MRAHGVCPAELEVYPRADGAVRFRIEQIGRSEAAVVDVAPADVDTLITELINYRAGRTPK